MADLRPVIQAGPIAEPLDSIRGRIPPPRWRVAALVVGSWRLVARYEELDVLGGGRAAQQ